MTDRPAQSAPRCLNPEMCGRGPYPIRCEPCSNARHPATSAPPERPGEDTPVSARVGCGGPLHNEEELRRRGETPWKSKCGDISTWSGEVLTCASCWNATRANTPAPPADVAGPGDKEGT